MQNLSSCFSQIRIFKLQDILTAPILRAITRALIGGEYSYIRVLSDEFFFKSTLMTTDVKINSSGRTRMYEYSLLPPPPPINALITALDNTKCFRLKFSQFPQCVSGREPCPDLKYLVYKFFSWYENTFIKFFLAVPINRANHEG